MATSIANTSAIVLRKPGEPAKLEQVKLGPLRADEALIEIHATGVCHSDLVCLDGTFPVAPPIVLGHEGTSDTPQSTCTGAEFALQAQV
jgi:Zn-dependent alcohol dehydrogenase